MVFEHQALAPGAGTREKPPSGGPQNESALSGSSIFKPPALAEVMAPNWSAPEYKQFLFDRL